MKDPRFVPSLEEMREMSDADLLYLRTSITYDMGMIESQIRFSADADPDGTPRSEDWLQRAMFAQHRRQHGVSTIKNILTERAAERRLDQFAIPLERWLDVVGKVVTAAEALAEEDDDDNWDALMKALATYKDFAIRVDILRDAVVV